MRENHPCGSPGRRRGPGWTHIGNHRPRPASDSSRLGRSAASFRARGREWPGRSIAGLDENGPRKRCERFLVLDTAPNADQTASLAARSADLVLIPCRASTFDLEAIETTLLLAKAAGKPAYVVLNAVPPRSGIGKEAAEGLTGRGAKVAPHADHPASCLHPQRHRWSNSPGIRAGRKGRRGDPTAVRVDMWCYGHAHTRACTGKRHEVQCLSVQAFLHRNLPATLAQRTRLPRPVTAEFRHGNDARPPSRVGKRVLSIYLNPIAWRQFRELALDLETSTQALGEEAINLLFEKHRRNRSA